MKLLIALVVIILIACAPTTVRQQALYSQSETPISNLSMLLNNFRSDKFEYYVLAVDGYKIGDSNGGSLGIHEILLKPGMHKIKLYSAIIKSTNAALNPDWKGEVTCNTKPDHFYTINLSESGESQGRQWFLAGPLVTGDDHDIKIGCFEHTTKPVNSNLSGKTVLDEILYSK